MGAESLLQDLIDSVHYHADGWPDINSPPPLPDGRPWWDTEELQADPEPDLGPPEPIPVPQGSIQEPGQPQHDLVAGPAADVRKAEQLLDAARREGSAVLARLSAAAVQRMLASGTHVQASLFTPEERGELAAALSATLAAADLLGRSRVRIRAERVLQAEPLQKFGEADPTPFERFDESLAPMAPTRAVEYFRSLVPALRVGPDYTAQVSQQGFTLAGQTDLTLLGRVKDIILRRLETGQGISAAPGEIQSVLSDAGVSPGNPQYSEMVFRTNAMGAFNRGAMEELQDPEVADLFPVWRYAAIVDVRSRPHHADRNGTYWPNAVPFEQVRGTDISDVANCRCTMVPVSKYEWAELQAQGAQVQQFSERPVRKHADLTIAVQIDLPDFRQSLDYDCGAASLQAVLGHFGIHVPEGGLIKVTGTTPEGGVPPEDLAAEARRFGLKATAGVMGLEDVARHLAIGRPVIVPLQVGDPIGSDSGHYVVVIAAGPAGLMVSDPIYGRWTLTPGDMESRWHDVGGNGKRYERYGIVIWK